MCNYDKYLPATPQIDMYTRIFILLAYIEN